VLLDARPRVRCEGHSPSRALCQHRQPRLDWCLTPRVSDTPSTSEELRSRTGTLASRARISIPVPPSGVTLRRQVRRSASSSHLSRQPRTRTSSLAATADAVGNE
jgi:hypothetical protein